MINWLKSAALALMPLTVGVAQAQDQFVDPNTMRPSQDPARKVNGLAQTPPMGWNSWNKFGCTITDATVRAMADAMVSNGMQQAGYRYIVIDDCWHGNRDADGFITANAEKFPNGIKAVADYVHAKGLKFGIYSDAGAKTCGGKPGSQGHEYQDALTYARWGVDYLKYDWCSTGVRNAEEAYALMSDAIKAAGRPMVLAMCEWGNNRPWEWGAKIGNLWRTTADIRDAWAGREKWSIGMTDIVDLNERLYPYAGPGHWNDPDMLEVGNGGMTPTEYRSHFSLWAMMAAPLIAGNDIAHMDADTRTILLNQEVIAVDQDPLGQQGRRIRDDGDLEVWARPLADGSRAVILFNRSAAPASISVAWPELGLTTRVKAEVRDLWAHKSLGRKTGSFAATVAPHGVVMVKVTP
jgi:alpha-galactosidase